MPEPALTLDLTRAEREFRKAVKFRLLVGDRSFAEQMNMSGMMIARTMRLRSPIGDRGKIRTEMMQGSRVNPAAPLAAIIINSRLGKSGQRGLKGKAMREKVAAMTSARTRGVGTVRRGWNKPFRMLAAAVKGQKFDPSAGKGKRVKLEGDAKVAKGWIGKDAKTVRIIYDAIDKTTGQHDGRNVYQELMTLLSEVITQEATSMVAAAKRKMAYIWSPKIRKGPFTRPRPWHNQSR